MDKELNEWSVGKEPEVARACSFCTAEKATIIISDEVLAAIYQLCEKVEDEWQMLLTGTEDAEKHVVRVTGYYIPKQEITAASVKNLDCIDKARIDELGIVATIHSHSNMDVFFSHTDETKTNKSLIKNHIVWNNKGEYKAIRAVRLPCGMNKFIDATVVRDMPPLPKIKKVKGYKKIKKPEYKYPARGYHTINDDDICTPSPASQWRSEPKRKDLIEGGVDRDAIRDNEVIAGTRKHHAFHFA